MKSQNTDCRYIVQSCGPLVRSLTEFAHCQSAHSLTVGPLPSVVVRSLVRSFVGRRRRLFVRRGRGQPFTVFTSDDAPPASFSSCNALRAAAMLCR